MSLSYHTLILKNDGTLWGCGANGSGQLGLRDSSGRSTFTQITINTNDIKSVYSGDSHTLILKNDGILWASGYNTYGQLGLGDSNNRSTFTKITTNADNIKSVYCGLNHNFILKNNGTLWGCGKNDYGQLGLDDTGNRATFTQITTNTHDVQSVYCGNTHTLMLKYDGTLWGCRQNDYGELGLENISRSTTFKQITTNADDTKSVYCGECHTIILKNDGTLWGCGYNGEGELGLGDTTHRYVFTHIIDDVKLVCCGDYHTIILKNDGTLWGCGDNSHGQLGLGDTANRTILKQITTNASDIKSIYCGHYYTLILKNDGTLWGCGYNGYGQLGLGDTSSRTIFTQITTNTDNIKSFANYYPIVPSIIKIYDTKIGYAETLDTNNFRNIPVDKFEKIKVLYANPNNTYLNCLISFDKKQTWKTFDGLNWNTISDISPENIILNGMDLKNVDQLTRNNLISGGLTGDLDFKIAMKTNNVKKTPSVTKIYIEYK